ncbi:hypothetical protein PIB30_067678 [Stylosanthes scabra]|uniref:Uncharacterized protein n=1 Tax=Stylosanthes scabra TaxID=79078 RepID=A0ABU6RN69_9FABA|nr:hypothetical protein [Stylosanthes scabra]
MAYKASVLALVLINNILLTITSQAVAECKHLTLCLGHGLKCADDLSYWSLRARMGGAGGCTILQPKVEHFLILVAILSISLLSVLKTQPLEPRTLFSTKSKPQFSTPRENNPSSIPGIFNWLHPVTPFSKFYKVPVIWFGAICNELLLLNSKEFRTALEGRIKLFGTVAGELKMCTCF